MEKEKDNQQDSIKFVGYTMMGYDGISQLVNHDINRDPDENHINKLLKKMKKWGSGTFEPITVLQNTKKVINGFHRVCALVKGVKEGVLPPDSMLCVKFVECTNEDILSRYLMDVSCVVRKWTPRDSMHGMIALGDENVDNFNKWAQAEELTVKKVRNGYPEINKRYACILFPPGLPQKMEQALNKCEGFPNLTASDFKLASQMRAEITSVLNTIKRFTTLTGNPRETFLRAYTHFRYNNLALDFNRYLKDKVVPNAYKLSKDVDVMSKPELAMAFSILVDSKTY